MLKKIWYAINALFLRQLLIAPHDQSVSPAVLRRVMRELSELENNPPEGIRVQTSDEDMLDVTGIIEGPGASISINLSNHSLILSAEGTPYAGGYFRVKFKFTEEFPSAPPKCVPNAFVLYRLLILESRLVRNKDLPSQCWR